MEVTDFTPGLDWKQNSALAISSWTSPPLDRRRRRGGSRRSAPPLIRQQGGRGVGGRWDVHNQHSMGRAGQINNLTILPFKGITSPPSQSQVHRCQRLCGSGDPPEALSSAQWTSMSSTSRAIWWSRSKLSFLPAQTSTQLFFE